MVPIAKRYPRLAFFALGFLVAAIAFWPAIYLAVFARTTPSWVSIAAWVVPWIPWIVILGILMVRAARGPVIRAGSFIAGVLTHWALTAGVVAFGDIAADYWHRQPFDTAAWRRNDRSDVMWPARLTMVDDLLKRHELRGLTRDSVEKLLGPRDNTTSWPEWDLVYYLGPERGLIRIDSETLVIKLGPDGRATDYRIARD